MRIGEVARKLGISRDWLRRLEKAGRVPPAVRDLNGVRRYQAEDIAAIKRALFGPGPRIDDAHGQVAIDAEAACLREWAERHGIPWTEPGERGPRV